jgi:hypothetical protein
VPTVYLPLYVGGALPPGSIGVATESDDALPFASNVYPAHVAVEVDTALAFTVAGGGPPPVPRPMPAAAHGHGVPGGYLRTAWAYAVIAPDGSVVEYGTYVAAAAAAAANGGTIVAVPAPPLAVTLVDRSDFRSNPVRLGDAFGKKFQDQINEVGSGSVVLLNDDPQLPLLNANRALTFSLAGRSMYSILVETDDMTQVAEGEEAAQETVFAGRGNIALLQDAVVYPSRGVGVLPIEEDRVFNWTAPFPVYDDSGWRRAKQLMTVAQAQTDWPYLPFAEGWPDPATTGVITPSMGLVDYAPVGTWYLRKTFTLAEGGFYLLYVSADNAGELFLDGQKVVDIGGFTGLFSYFIEMTAGTHTMAAWVWNAPQVVPPALSVTDSNPTSLIFALYTANPAGVAGTRVLVSDSTWKIVEYPPHPPGMTPGEVVLHLAYEAMGRGCFPNLNWTFDRYVDSSGTPWPEVTNIGTKVGTDYLTFLSKELAPTYVDFRMAPSAPVLSLWNRGGLGGPRPVTYHPPTDPNDPASGNIAGLTRRRTY